MSKIEIEILRKGGWVLTPWGEDFDGHPEDMPSRACVAMAELEVGCGVDSLLRALCIPDSDMQKEGFEVVIVDQEHRYYEDALHEEIENERERAEGERADAKREERRELNRG